MSSVDVLPASQTEPFAPSRPSWACDFVINGRFLSQPVTGVQRYAQEIVVALDELLTRNHGACQVLAPSAASLVNYRSIEIARIGRTGGYLWEQSELPAYARKPILSLCNLGPLLTGEQVVCIHDVNVFREPASYSWIFRSAYKTLVPALARRAARIATVSRASLADLTQYLPLKSRDVAVIPNGHEHALRWRASRSSLAQSLNGRRPFVLLIGSVARHKNLELVLNQSEALEDLGLDIVVAGGTASIFAESAKLRRTSISWLGRVTDDDLAYLYSNALCLAFPSRSEGFGLPLAEAMALGCPVVSSDRTSMLEVCGDAALHASPDDPEAWFGHFSALLKSAQLCAELATRGRERVRRFSWTESARAYLNLWRYSI